MANWKYFYLVRIEFLGFRYHGWQKQANLRSIHGMIDKTLLFVLENEHFRTLGCGRTDAKVSADDYAFELFINEEVIPNQLLKRLNKNLPSDIRAKSIEAVDARFNVIQNTRLKEYHYHFSFGTKSHPFIAPIIRDFGKKLDIEKMKLAAKEFEGIHNFKRYVSKPSPDTQFEREILSSEIVAESQIIGNYVPQNAFVFKVSAKGFMRYQVRLMMGALIEVGRDIWSIEDLRLTLEEYDGIQVRHVAPSSGLILHSVEFENEISS